jgi:hypothetical protein
MEILFLWGLGLGMFGGWMSERVGAKMGDG